MAKITILFAIIYFSGIIGSLVYGAHWAFYLYQVIYFLNPTNHWWSSTLPAFGYSKIVVLIMFATYVLNRKSLAENHLLKNPQFKWMFLLILIYIFILFVALNFDLHKTAAIEYVKLFIVISLAYKVLDNFTKLEWSLLVYILGCTFIGYETFLTGRDSFGRVEGVGFIDAPEANGTAAALVPAFPLIIYFLWWGNYKIKALMLLCGPVILNSIILINSRGAFLGTAISIMVFMFSMIFSKYKKPKQRLFAVFLIVLGLSGIVTLVDLTFMERMATLQTIEDESASGSHRYRMWLSAIEMAKDHPLGLGAAGYNQLSPLYVPADLFAKVQLGKSVHSMWFQALSEVGWLGFIVFLALIGSTILSIRKTRKVSGSINLQAFYLATALYAAFIGICVANSFINQFRTQMIYWCILFISCFYNIVINRSLLTPDKSTVAITDYESANVKETDRTVDKAATSQDASNKS